MLNTSAVYDYVSKSDHAPNYLTEHSAGSILRSAVQILATRFGTVFLVLVAPLLPLSILSQEAWHAGHVVVGGFFFFLSNVVSLFASGALTIVLADVCLGNQPSAVRAYRRVFSVVAGKLFLTNLAAVLIMLLGFFLLIVPGLLAIVWLMFTPQIVVLEGVWGFDACRRSRRLGHGYHWRNAGVLAVITACFIVLVIFVSLIVGTVGLFLPDTFEVVGRALGAGLSLLVGVPLILIANILLYYDLRVRKESYDVAALAEALRH